RRVVIYELADPPIDLWGWHYPNRIATGELYVSGRARSAHEGGGVEVGRTLARDGFAPGVVVMPSDLKVGRRVILTDARGEALTATISSPPRLTAADEGFCHLVLALDADGELDLDDDSAVL